MKDESSREKKHRCPQGTGSLVTSVWIWFGALGGAVAWFLHLVLAYVIAEFGCVSGLGKEEWIGISVIAWLGIMVSGLMIAGALIASGAAMKSQRRWSLVHRSNQDVLGNGQEFLAKSGVISNLLFGFIILVQSIPFVFYLHGC